MEGNKTNNWVTGKIHIYLISVMAIWLLFYAGYRSWNLSFTHDESFCYTRYVTHSFGDIVSYKNPTANNHILNTLLMKFFSNIFPPTEFVLRLPNLLALFCYLIFSFLILRRLKSKFLMVTGFIILNFNPYLLEFFSLGRGYGISATLMLMSIYYLIVYLEKKEKRQVYFAMTFAMLALYSNFVLMHYFMSLIAVFNLIFINDFFIKNRDRKGIIKHLLKKNIPVLIVFAVVFIISYEPVRKLVKFNELYGRGQNGFWIDTVLSFVHGSFYGVNYHFDLVRLFMFLSMLMIAIAAVFFFLEYRKNGFDISRSKGSILLLILILPALSTIFQHMLMGSEYLIYRTTLFFHPLLGLTLIYLIWLAIQNEKLKYAAYALTILLSVAMLFHIFKSSNLTKTHEWDYDAQTKTMISDLEQAYIADALTNRSTPNKINLGISWIFEPTINYYRISRKLKWLNEVNRNGVEGDYDFYYIFQEDTSGIAVKKQLKSYKLTFDGRPTETLLLSNPQRY